MKRDERAAVLLVTLWILAILSLLAIGIGFRTSIDLRLTSYQIDKLKAYEIAKAGIVKTITELEKDESPKTDTICECGITLGQNGTFDEKFRHVKIGDGYFNVPYIEDMQGKININSAPIEVLKSLFLEVPGVAESVMKWRGSVESDPGDYPDKQYTCKGAFFDDVNELLLVKDVTPEIFNEVRDSITVYGPEDFKININTADQKTLEVLLGACDVIDTSSIAANIVKYRAGPDGDIMTKDDNPPAFNSTNAKGILEGGDIGISDTTALANLMNLIVFNSSYFKISSVGSAQRGKTNIRKTITCVVKRTGSGPYEIEIISWFEE